MGNKVLGRLVGNTGDPNSLTMIMHSSFAGRRGEFVRVRHQEREEESATDVLGRIISIHRSNVLYNSGMGSGVTELELLPGARITGENLQAKLELVGYKDPVTGRIRIPRRPLDPGANVETVDYQFLSEFYEFQETTGLHLGNLVGYDRGNNVVPVYLDVATLVTEHVAVLAMTGAGKSYTIGRIIERLVALHNGTVVVFDPHGEYGKALANGRLQLNDISGVEDTRDQKVLPTIQRILPQLSEAGGGVMVYTPQLASFRHKYAGENSTSRHRAREKEA